MPKGIHRWRETLRPNSIRALLGVLLILVLVAGTYTYAAFISPAQVGSQFTSPRVEFSFEQDSHSGTGQSQPFLVSFDASETSTPCGEMPLNECMLPEGPVLLAQHPLTLANDGGLDLEITVHAGSYSAASVGTVMNVSIIKVANNKTSCLQSDFDNADSNDRLVWQQPATEANWLAGSAFNLNAHQTMTTCIATWVDNSALNDPNYQGKQGALAWNFEATANQWTTESSIETAPITLGIWDPSCQQGGDCELGDTGPGGGVVFYDAGSQQSWGRWLEYAPSGWSGSPTDPSAPWGCSGQVLPGPFEDGYGTGKANTQRIVNQCADNGTAASQAQAYNGGNKNDWYLPNLWEINRLCLAAWNNAAAAPEIQCLNGRIGNRLAGFSASLYSTSSQNTSNSATQFITKNFSNGGQSGGTKANNTPLRPIRAISEPSLP